MSDQPKKPVPPAVLYKNSGELPPVEYNWPHIMQVCRDALTRELEYVILPVEELQDFKPQRRRLVKGDKESPRGLIQRDRYAKERYWPYASARFDVDELLSYAAAQFNALAPAELERMAQDLLSGIDS